MRHSNCDICGHDTKMCECGVEPDNRYVSQEGGSHYQTKYQHWDWVIDIGLGYLAGCATKYVVRWPKKNGVQDLNKAMTYVHKMILSYNPRVKPNRDFNHLSKVVTQRFFESNGISGTLEGEFCWLLANRYNMSNLTEAKWVLEQIIRNAQRAQEAHKDKPCVPYAFTPTRTSLD